MKNEHSLTNASVRNFCKTALRASLHSIPMKVLCMINYAYNIGNTPKHNYGTCTTMDIFPYSLKVMKYFFEKL